MSTRYLILSGATLVLLSCEEPKPKAVRFEVEATAAAPQDPLPGMVEGETRPVAVLVPDVGAAVRFVANELVLAADSAEAIDAAAVRLGAEVRALLDPVTTQLTGLKYLGLLRLQAPPADAASLADATVRLAAKDGAQPTGRYRVTSEPGLRLLALAAAEAEAGAAVAINWVLEGAAIPTNTQEAPTVDRGLSSDAYLWPHLGVATPQRFGVAEAWSLLHRAGKLGNRVRLAVLDSGFSDLAAPQQDIGVATALSVFPWHSAWGSNLGSCGSGDCPWHGQNVASTAMARVDDGFGGAGSAGPVAEPVLINTTYDYFTAISAVLNARAQGARVINMSFGASIPTIVAWTIYPFEATTALIRASGTLLFAAAGNSGENVDAEDCFAGICWESSWHTPCENNGVICVGGLGYNATVLDPGSNYGEEHVDVYGPYHVLVGPDPEHLANEARLVSGTSFSSPFAAGVAALVWAADPTLPASTVEEAVTRVTQASP
ncbi:MAG: S8 family serine peptidase, partial [Deltaproteobacteria bacterium]|nr:S8 family serine peptidase [Deltaproteobacteria bacterium]